MRRTVYVVTLYIDQRKKPHMFLREEFLATRKAALHYVKSGKHKHWTITTIRVTAG